jgi:hypothetical protein
MNLWLHMLTRKLKYANNENYEHYSLLYFQFRTKNSLLTFYNHHTSCYKCPKDNETKNKIILR